MNAISQISTSGTLSTRAMLMYLKICQWSGRKLDRKVTDEVNQQHNADADAGRYNKLLLPKEAMADVVSAVSKLRSGFLDRTLPWMNDGTRIMAADAYLQNSQWFAQRRDEFDNAVQDFLLAYPGHVQAQQKRLNGMFDPDDYPSVAELRDKFDVHIKVMPVPTADDFRANISDTQAMRIRQDIEREVAQASETAVRHVFERIADMTKRMAERLPQYVPSQGKGKPAQNTFRESLVENIRDLIDVLPGLNITGDPRLTAMVDELKPLVEYTAQDLREDETLRLDTAAKAAEIYESMSGFMA